MEFRNSIAPTGVDIPARVVDYVLDVANARITLTLPTFVIGANGRMYDLEAGLLPLSEYY